MLRLVSQCHSGVHEAYKERQVFERCYPTLKTSLSFQPPAAFEYLQLLNCDVYSMDPNANNTSTTRGQLPPQPSDAQSGTRGLIPASVAYFPFVIPVYQQTSVSQWEVTPGPYDRRGYYIPPAASAPPADTARKGKHSAQISSGQPVTPSTTHLIARQNISGGSTTPYKNITTNHPHDDFRLLGIEMKSPYAVLYLSIGGPPLTFKSDGLEQHPIDVRRQVQLRC